MIGNALLIAGGSVGFFGMAVWYLLLKNYLKKNGEKTVDEIEPTVKKFMTASSVMAVLFFVLSVTGVLLRIWGI